jgi:hypothetical protein
MSWSKLHKNTLTASCTEWVTAKVNKIEKKAFLERMANTIEIERKTKHASEPPLTNLMKVVPFYYCSDKVAYVLERKFRFGIKTMSSQRRQTTRRKPLGVSNLT